MLKLFLTKTIYFVLAVTSLSAVLISCNKDDSGNESYTYQGDLTPLVGFTGTGQIKANLSNHELDLNINFSGIPIVRAYLVENKNGSIRIQNIADNPVSPFNTKITISDSTITALNLGNIGVELLTTTGAIALRGYLTK